MNLNDNELNSTSVLASVRIGSAPVPKREIYLAREKWSTSQMASANFHKCDYPRDEIGREGPLSSYDYYMGRYRTFRNKGQRPREKDSGGDNNNENDIDFWDKDNKKVEFTTHLSGGVGTMHLHSAISWNWRKSFAAPLDKDRYLLQLIRYLKYSITTGKQPNPQDSDVIQEVNPGKIQGRVKIPTK